MGRDLQRPTALSLAVNVPIITFDENNARVMELFSRHRELVSLAVLENDRPIGLISRDIFMSQMSQPYHRELYEKKSCIAFMDKNPLIVEAGTPIETLGALTVESGDKTLADGFLIVDDGKFVGLGSGLELMRMLVALQAEKNRQVMQSIDYASVIQRAMLGASRTAMAQALDDACLIWEPRDVVGGDFYHLECFPDGWFAAVADCTGHGVPGAFLTLLASSSLKQALELHGPHDPARVMGEVNRGMKRVLGQQANGAQLSESESDDGMDACFFWFDAASQQLTCANAKMSLLTLLPSDEDVHTFDGERIGLGYVDTPDDMQWTNRRVQLVAGAIVLIATDGIIDQIGGPKNIAFGKRRLRNALLAYRDLPMKELGKKIMDEQTAYQGQQRRRDDLTFFSFRLSGSINSH
jgi:sigma-B regulation protein RsbU (phosphoserine phosphatase)